MKFFRVLCVLCGLVLSAAALDREAFTFTKYDLQVRVEPEQQRLGVRGRIALRNDSDAPQKNVALQISSTLSWRSIQAGGKPLEFVSQPYVSDVDHTGSLSEAIVLLPQAILPKGTLELSVGYEGTIPLDATRLARIGVPEEIAQHSDWDQISKAATAVRGIGYVAWYPVAIESATLSEGNSVFEALGRWRSREINSAATITFCADSGGAEPAVIIANGTPASAAGPGCRRYDFSAIGAGGLTFAFGAYTSLSKPSLDVEYLPDHRVAAEAYALATDLAASFVSDWFGPPRQSGTVVELADADAAPYESGTFLFTPLKPDADSRAAQLTAVYQLMHATIDSPRLWIYEGLAHFAQAVYREQHSGRQSALDLMAQRAGGLADAEKAFGQGDAARQSLINTTIEDFYRNKATYVWWMLRDQVGEPALKKALAAYRADQDKEPSYVQHLIEAQSKRDLEWFFDDWVYRDRGLPDFRVESAYARAILGGGYMVTITVENLGNAGAEVPVTLHFQGGEVGEKLEVRAKAKAVTRLESSSTPLEVVVNDGSVPESDMSNNSFKIQAGSN